MQLNRPCFRCLSFRYEHNYEASFYETNRIDAVAMERLTSSPHVTDIYGYCGMSVMTEYGEGDFKPLIDAAEPLEKLKYAIDVASGLAATHYMDGYDRNLTMVHNDLNPTNVMVSNGTIKLNDYNIGILMTWHKDENRLCHFHNRDFANAQWRAPEEQFVDDEPADEAHTEKIDIYALGNIFFRIIAEHDPWKEYKIDGRIYPEQRNEIAKRKRHFGDLPKFLDKPEVETSTDPSIVAIRNVMRKCFELDPKERPTAIEIEKELYDAYQEILRTVSSNATDAT
jgi:serine/threonine protein kinase